MKILKVVLVILGLSCGYILPAVGAFSDISTAPQEVQKNVRKTLRHHRGMSKAMMNELNLSDKQKAQWQEISAQKKVETDALREQVKKLREQERKLNEKYEAKIKKILTDEQIKKYESMLPKRREKPEGKLQKLKK